MKGLINQFVARVRHEARRKKNALTFPSMGRQRTFTGYDWGGDTFIFERDVWRHLDNHTPILIVRKRDLIKNTSGYIMTLTTGNHSVAAIPLLSGQFWNLGRVPAARRSAILRDAFVCANAVNGKIEISQRDVPTALVTAADEWLQSVGMPLDGALMAERDDRTLDFYRKQGQEWRIKPLAWTRREMDFAIRTSRTHINTRLSYYHSAKGVHFLSYAEFHRLPRLAEADPAALEACLRELVSVFEGDDCSFMRKPKFHGHHEIELFGVRWGAAERRIIPALERLLGDVAGGAAGGEEALRRLAGIDAEFLGALERPSLADESSTDFVETLYMHLTGEIYYTHNDLGSPAFDDRRTALPGATFRGGRPDYHPGADERTRVLFANVNQILSQNELIEYANVYEIRSTQKAQTQQQPLGSGGTREIVFKTNRRALCTSLIEKRLAQRKPGYGSYMLARVQAFKDLGASFGSYRLLMLDGGGPGRVVNYFLRTRCEGEPLHDVPERIFKHADGSPGEDPNTVLALGALLGKAAAQNIILKKYVASQDSCRFGIGKEVFAFGFDMNLRREMPVSVSLCSIRGCMGWPDTSHTEENLDRVFAFCFPRYAAVLHKFWTEHRDAVPSETLASRFFDGFEIKTREMHWNYTARREQFDNFDPHLPPVFGFAKKWRFALWALDRQTARLPRLRAQFLEEMRAAADRADLPDLKTILETEEE